MFPRLFLCAVLAAQRWTCCGFNVDVKFPVIKEGKTSGSLFGFSVALHSQTKGAGRYLLLAGAPKEKARSLPNVNETGAVYSCPISTDPTDCTRMKLLTSTDQSSELVEGMWLGVTVASQRSPKDGRVLACGHRYVKITSGQQRRMIGKCYVRGNDLTFDPSDEWQSDKYERCDPNNNEDTEGMCNMGISGGITETDVVLGSPGSYTWTGNVHVTWRDPDPDKFWNIYNKQIGKLENKHSYVGYSVLEAQKLLSRADYTLVTGAPRDESKGSVMLGTQNDDKIKMVHTILGEQVGSHFGSSLAATDLDNDDWNDLIIGAPFHFNRVEEEGGAVYIFMNENGSFQQTRTLMLTGKPHSGFGMAVAAIGDVNQDGFQDFAVGAPFYKTGVVYIWMGSKKGISQRANQEIEGKSVNGNFQTFGYSINAGLDADNNGYPDILVGSLDDRVALLRARPVIHLTKDFSAEPKIVDPNLCPANKPCIAVKLCLSFTLSNGNNNFKKNINVNYVLEADSERRSPRVRFQNNDMSSYSGSLSLPSSKPICETLKLGVVEPVKDKLEPVVFFLNVTLPDQKPDGGPSLQNLDSFAVTSQEQKLTQKIEINFQKECGSDNKCSSNLQLSAEFANDAGIPFPRRENTQVLQFDKTIKKISLLVSVSNLPAAGRLAEDAHQTTLNVSVPDGLTYSGVRPEKAFECSSDVAVICELGNPLKGNTQVSLQLLFETSGIDLYTTDIETQMILSTLSEQKDLRPVMAAMQIETTIEPSFSMKNPPEPTRFGGTVKGEYAMVNSSDVGSLVEFTLGVDMRKQPLGDMGTLAVDFDWPHEAANGKWLLYLTKIVVKGESETECHPAGEVINPRNLTLSASGPKHGRSKRQAADVDDDEEEETVQLHTVELQPAISLYKARKSYTFDCSKETARCIRFTCPLLNVSNSAEIHVRSRLWNGTMLEDCSNALRVTVTGNATLKLVTDKPTIKMEPQHLIFSVDIEPEESAETPYELPLWIVISAAVAGIVLLGIIIVILWKCGFFQRASRREMYEAKAQKAEMKIQPSETEKMIEDF